MRQASLTCCDIFSFELFQKAEGFMGNVFLFLTEINNNNTDRGLTVATNHFIQLHYACKTSVSTGAGNDDQRSNS